MWCQSGYIGIPGIPLSKKFLSNNPFHWLGAAAAKSHADAQFQLGEMLREGRGCSPDLHIAKYWYQKAAALHHPTAQLHLNHLMHDEAIEGADSPAGAVDKQESRGNMPPEILDCSGPLLHQ